MKPLDLNKPLQTRDGQPVTILTTERPDSLHPVVGMTNAGLSALPIDPDAQAALDKMLDEARLEGWRAGRDAAANEAALYGCSEGADEYTKGIQEGYTDAVTQIVDGIRSMPEPKEASHD